VSFHGPRPSFLRVALLSVRGAMSLGLLCTVTFEFVAPPPLSRVTLSPSVATVEAGASARVELVYAPLPTDTPETVVGSSVPSTVAASGVGSGSGSEPGSSSSSGAPQTIPRHVGAIVVSQEAQSNEPWSAHARWTIPCFMRPAGASAGA
jgi:hypothetical protein